MTPELVSPPATEPGPEKPVPANRDSLLRRFLTPTPQFDLAGADSPERQELETFVAGRYQTAYQAEVSQFLPWLLSMRCLGTISGVAGMRPAGQQALFLEQYLDVPLEQLLAEVSGSEVSRSAIVEIGNLVASQRGASHLLFLLFTTILHRAGYEWITFTATRSLRNSLAKLGFPLLVLQVADARRLDPQDRKVWGTYYATDPQVVAGRLSDAMQIIQSRTLLRRVLRMYRHKISYLAEELGIR